MTIRIHRWVIWWFCLGVICGAVALINIFFRDLTRTQEKVVLFVGVMHWLLGGLVCWAWEGVKLDKPKDVASKPQTEVKQESEQGAAAEFAAHPRGQALPRSSRVHQGLLGAYLLRHWEHKLGRRS
jgi:hypothetical protein